MSREIKFRGLFEELFPNKRTWVYYGIGSKPGLLGPGAFWVVEDLQYTGIKDRQGVEIYEGDVLNTADGNMVVEWDTDGQWVINDPGIDLWYPLWKWAKLGAVIGNVYEHPELVDPSCRHFSTSADDS